MFAIIIFEIFDGCLLCLNGVIKLHKNVILPLVLYGCKTWSFILREDHRRRLYENRAQRRILEPDSEYVTGRWRNFHVEEFLDLRGKLLTF
jgi:hypothetical protein